MTVASSTHTTTAAKTSAEPMRKDIQALRAIAVGAVVLGHLWPHIMTGGRVGVDVFFVISGFLITSHLFRKPPVDRRTLLAFWARRIRRLLPAAALVLAVTVVGAWLLLPGDVARATAGEASAASVYVENWARYLAGQGSAVLADRSPIQHYWSLSVEEEFYVLWPLLMGALYLLGRRIGKQLQVVGWGMAVVVLASFIASVWTTYVNEGLGYFGTHVRIWELGLGGLVAYFFERRDGLPLSPAIRSVVAWGGAAMIGYAAMFFTTEPFPGPYAAIPVLGAALVILANSDRTPLGFGRIFNLRPIQYLGDMSYSVYLWHWPVIELMPFILPFDINWPARVGMFVLMCVLGSLTREFVEEKLRYQRGIVRTVPRSYALGGVCIAGVLALSGLVAAIA